METNLRSIVKGAIYRGLSFILSTAVAWAVTGQLQEGLMISFIYGIGGIIIFFIHERAWLKVKWGMSKETPN